MRIHALGFAVVLSLTAPAQNVIVVQGGGAALQQAVNAANPGDVLDVMPGTYTPVSATRGLRFELRPGVQVSSAGSAPAITVTGLPANEACVVHGARVENLWLFNCAGAVVVDGVRLGGTFNFSSPFANSRIDNCTGPVVWQDCGGTPSFPLQAISVNSSAQVSLLRVDTVYIVSTGSNLDLVGVSCPRDPLVAFYGGLQIMGGRASIAGGYFEGGVRAGAPTSEPGITLWQGHLAISGGAVARAVQALPGPPPMTSAILVNSGSAWIDPSVSSIGTGGAPPVGVAGISTVIAKAIPSVTVARVPQSVNYQLSIAGEPGALVFTLLGLPQPVWSLPFGDAWLSDVSPIVLVNVMPGSGTATHAGSLAGAPPYLILVAQSVALTTANDIVIGVPARFVWD